MPLLGSMTVGSWYLWSPAWGPSSTFEPACTLVIFMSVEFLLMDVLTMFGTSLYESPSPVVAAASTLGT